MDNIFINHPSPIHTLWIINLINPNETKWNLINQFDFMPRLCCNHWCAFHVILWFFPDFMLSSVFSLSSNTQNTKIHKKHKILWKKNVEQKPDGLSCLLLLQFGIGGALNKWDSMCFFIVFYCPNIPIVKAFRFAWLFVPAHCWASEAVSPVSGVFGELLNALIALPHKLCRNYGKLYVLGFLRFFEESFKEFMSFHSKN